MDRHERAFVSVRDLGVSKSDKFSPNQLREVLSKTLKALAEVGRTCKAGGRKQGHVLVLDGCPRSFSAEGARRF